MKKILLSGVLLLVVASIHSAQLSSSANQIMSQKLNDLMGTKYTLLSEHEIFAFFEVSATKINELKNKLKAGVNESLKRFGSPKNGEAAIGYCIVSGNDSKEFIVQSSANPVDPLPKVDDGDILLVGCSNDSIQFVVNGKNGELYKQFRKTGSSRSNLLRKLLANFRKSRTSQFSVAEQATFNALPDSIKKNLRLGFTIPVSTSEQSANLQVSTSSILSQSVPSITSQSQPAASAEQLELVRIAALTELAKQNQQSVKQEVEQRSSSGQQIGPNLVVTPREQALPKQEEPQRKQAQVEATAQEGWKWKWGKRVAIGGALVGTVVVCSAGGPVAALVGAKTLAIKYGLIKAVPIVAKAAWWKLGLLGL